MEPILYSGQEFTFEIVYRKNICTVPVLPHIHDAVEIYLTLSPLPNVLLGNQVVSAEPGTLILIPPFCVHQLFDQANQLYERYILSIHAAWLENVICHAQTGKYLLDTSRPLVLSLPASASQLLRRSFEELLALGENHSFTAIKCFFGCMEQMDHMISLLDAEKTENIRSSATQQTVADIIRYLDEHIDQPVMLRDLSACFHLHPDYLSRIFKKHTNTTVSSYITLQKMARAQQLLREGYTVSQVQLMTGYSSYAHFSRTFKQHIGISPGAYQNQ